MPGHVDRHGLPAEDLGVERGRGRDVGRHHLFPRQRAVLVHERRADVVLRPATGTIMAPVGSAITAHAARVHHVERRHHHRAARAGNLRGGRVDVGDGHVRVPVRRDTGHRQRRDRGDLLAVLRRHRIDGVVAFGVVAGRPVVVLPTEQCAVERLGADRVGGLEIDPAGSAGRVLGAFGHGVLLEVVAHGGGRGRSRQRTRSRDATPEMKRDRRHPASGPVPQTGRGGRPSLTEILPIAASVAGAGAVGIRVGHRARP